MAVSLVPLNDFFVRSRRWLTSPRVIMRLCLLLLFLGACFQGRLIWRQELVQRMATRRGDVVERAWVVPGWLREHLSVTLVQAVEPITGYRQLNSGRFSSDDAELLRGLSYLRSLRLERVAPDAWKNIARLQGLSALCLATSSDLTKDDLRHVVQLKQLRTLELRWTTLPEPSLQFLTELPYLEDLTIDGPTTRKVIFENGVDGPTRTIEQRIELAPDQLRLLASLPRLKRLLLRQIFRFDNDSLLTMTAMQPDGRPPFPNLESLEFDEVYVHGQALEQLQDLPKLNRLQFLNYGVGDQGITALQKVAGLRAIVGRCQLSDAGARALTAIPTLEILDISGDGLTDEGIQSIASIQSLKNLTLSDLTISETTAQALGRLPALERLWLNRCQIADNACLKLAPLHNLKSLYVTRHGTVDSAAIATLKKSLPKHCLIDVVPVTIDLSGLQPPSFQALQEHLGTSIDDAIEQVKVTP